MQYRVAVFSTLAGQWVLSGRDFADAAAAAAHMATIQAPFKRIVALRRPTVARRAEPPSLERRRLEFARYLVRRGVLSEQVSRSFALSS
jgi:hypothetical protein